MSREVLGNVCAQCVTAFVNVSLFHSIGATVIGSPRVEPQRKSKTNIKIKMNPVNKKEGEYKSRENHNPEDIIKAEKMLDNFWQREMEASDKMTLVNSQTKFINSLVSMFLFYLNLFFSLIFVIKFCRSLELRR